MFPKSEICAFLSLPLRTLGRSFVGFTSPQFMNNYEISPYNGRPYNIHIELNDTIYVLKLKIKHSLGLSMPYYLRIMIALVIILRSMPSTRWLNEKVLLMVVQTEERLAEQFIQQQAGQPAVKSGRPNSYSSEIH